MLKTSTCRIVENHGLFYQKSSFWFCVRLPACGRSDPGSVNEYNHYNMQAQESERRNRSKDAYWEVKKRETRWVYQEMCPKV